MMCGIDANPAFTKGRGALIITESDFQGSPEMEEINVTQAARNLSEMLNRVAYQGASFELTRGGRRIARLVPSGPYKEVQVSDLNALFARLPRLDPDDVDAFARDIAESDAALAPDRDPWN